MPSQFSAKGTEFDSLGCKSQVMGGSPRFSGLPAIDRECGRSLESRRMSGDISPGVAPQATQYHRFAVEIVQH